MKRNDIEKHTGICVAINTVDGCHGCAQTVLGRTDDDRDDIVRLRRSRCRSLRRTVEVPPVI